MKKFIFSMMALFAMVSTSLAEDKLVFGNAYVPQGGSATVAVSLISAQRHYGGFQFDVKLPKGISATGVIKAARLNNVIADDNLMVNLTDEENNVYNVLGFNSARKEIQGDDGDILYLVLSAEATVAIGEYTAEVTNGKMSTIEAVGFKSPDATFPIKVTDRLVLDENSTLPIAPSTSKANVTVKRNLKAGVWNTICLPFKMTKDQVDDIFGNHTLVAFDSWEVEFPDETALAPSAITIKFKTVTSGRTYLVGGTPYLIKTDRDLTQFDLDGVTIVSEALSVDKTITIDDIDFKGSFKGTFVSKKIPADGVFINGDKFWYSTGKTTTKGFRGWFDLAGVVGKDMDFGAKVGFVVDGEATDIDGILGYQRVVDGVYDLSGRKIQLQDGDLNKLQKGVYIINGKKVTIK